MKHLGFLFFTFFIGCSSPSEESLYTPKTVDLEIPEILKQKLIAPLVPANNPLTEEGIALGKKLFFDPILSENNTQSCASCHNPKHAFADITQFSEGIDGILGTRNAMPLFNLAWNFDERFMWDGKELSIERQAFSPVRNPIEMHSTWPGVMNRLQNHSEYPTLFKQAFGTTTVDSTLVVRAIAQFERTLISANSKFDNYLLGGTNLTTEELNGFQVFMDETRGDCFHCHGSNTNPLWTDNQFHNNGLDTEFTDLGLGRVTGDPNDNGKFKTPSLRNLAFTAPYMHDGRFTTLEEVIHHYSEGLKVSATVDPLMKKANSGGVHLSDQDKADLKAFLLALSDNNFVTNPLFQE